VADSATRQGNGLAALWEFFVSEATVGDTLTKVAELACHAAPADMAALTILVDGRPGTAVFTDPEAPKIDQEQYDSGRGPCLDAFRDRQVYTIESTAEETRWPEFCAMAAAHGICSTLSVPVIARDEALGALNLYSRQPAAFDEGTAGRMSTFARQSAFVLVNAQAYWDARTLSENLEQALRSRATIEQAKGIIMAAGGRTPEEAFHILTRASQRENRKLRDVAADLVAHAVERGPDAPDGHHR